MDLGSMLTATSDGAFDFAMPDQVDADSFHDSSCELKQRQDKEQGQYFEQLGRRTEDVPGHSAQPFFKVAQQYHRHQADQEYQENTLKSEKDKRCRHQGAEHCRGRIGGGEEGEPDGGEEDELPDGGRRGEQPLECPQQKRNEHERVV